MTPPVDFTSTPTHPLDAVMPQPHFSERHTRRVQAPLEVVWAAALALTGSEIRAAGPLMALRLVPRMLKERRWPQRAPDDATFLEAFQSEGFVQLHCDSDTADGQAFAIYGAAGRFWSLSDNSPTPLSDSIAFEQHSAPGTVKIAFSLEATASGDTTLLTTETRILATDARARRVFGRYWLIIRGPSGLIRRSWLAAIDRRACR